MKKATNLSIDTVLLEEARELNINLSKTLEEALDKKVREEKGRRWLEENKEAFESYNRYVEKYGVFSDKLRSF